MAHLVVLVDNHTLIDSYLLGEPALSLWFEADGQRILLDCGYSDAFARNAVALGLDLLELDHLVLSHSHLDHTWGLMELMRLHAQARFAGRKPGRPSLVAHPGVFVPTIEPAVGQIGSLIPSDRLGEVFDLKLSDTPVWLSDRLVFLGQIPRIFDFEAPSPIGTKTGGKPDMLADDSALAYRSGRGLVILTGCSHAGICNIVAHARQVCSCDRVADIVGGLHLLSPDTARLSGTCDFLSSLGLDALHACHCTDLASKIALARCAPVREVGSGLTLRYDE